MRAAPDAATVSGEIRRRAGSAAAARRLVERRVAEVLRNLDALGVARADVRTDSVRSFTTRRRGRVRHYASTSLVVRTTDLALLERILGAFGGASIPEFAYDSSTESASGGGTDDSGGGSGGSVEIEPGRERVQVAVAVVYEIGP